MNRFFYSNSLKWRLIRTIAQGIVGVLVANIDLLIGSVHIPPEYRPVVAALVMAVLSPVMSALGTEQMDKPELEPDHWEGDDEQGE